MNDPFVSPFYDGDAEQPGADNAPGTSRTAMTWTVRGQSVAKPSNDSYGTGSRKVWRQNEDRFRLADDGEHMLATVADGAGSSGIFCGAWAETLVERLPEAPISGIEDLNQWIDGFWENFSVEFKQRASEDPGKLSKFVLEGSFATLVSCWLRKQEDGIYMNWLGYGDSAIYVFAWSGDQIGLTSHYPMTLAAMERAPELLNWKDLPKEDHLRVGVLALPERATVILASDGVGQFILLRYLASLQAQPAGIEAVDPAMPAPSLRGEYRRLVRTGMGKLADQARVHLDDPSPGFEDELAALRAALESEEEFRRLVLDRHERGILPNDDATLIIIDIDDRGKHATEA